jgi:hypothetical protein
MLKDPSNSKSTFFRTSKLFTVLYFNELKQGFEIKINKKIPIDIVFSIANSRIEIRLSEMTLKDL